VRTLDPKAAVDGEKEEFPDSWRKCRPGTPIPQIFVASVKQSVENDAPMYVQLRSILQIFIDKSNRACLPKGKQAHGYKEEGEGGTKEPRRYKPGGLLTEQTGRIVDTLRHGRDVLERCYALENEQCDGRTSAFCL
jgi:hypothetical protein